MTSSPTRSGLIICWSSPSSSTSATIKPWFPPPKFHRPPRRDPRTRFGNVFFHIEVVQHGLCVANERRAKAILLSYLDNSLGDHSKGQLGRSVAILTYYWFGGNVKDLDPTLMAKDWSSIDCYTLYSKHSVGRFENNVPNLGTEFYCSYYRDVQKTISSDKYLALLSWLKQERERSGLSMRDIATLINEPHSWIGKIETAERRLDIFEYVKYCEALGVKPKKGLKLLK